MCVRSSEAPDANPCPRASQNNCHLAGPYLGRRLGRFLIGTTLRTTGTQGGDSRVLLLVVLAILALLVFSAGFVIHWLFIVAAVIALIWVISLFTGGLGRGARL